MEDTPMNTEETFAGFLGIKAAGVEAASTTGLTQQVGLSGITAVMLKVTAVSGISPTLEVTIQDGDNDPPTTNRLAWPQISAIGEYKAFLRTSKNYVRYVSTIDGINPRFTYSVMVTA